MALKLIKLWEVPLSDIGRIKERFDAEYQTGLIVSDNLVNHYGKGEIGGNPYILMEYCTNRDLRTEINNHAAVDCEKVAKDVLCGLNALHKNGKVHRDLKPENVLKRDNGTYVLTDFGICGDQNHRITLMGTNGVPRQRFGTFAYMPPEQLRPLNNYSTVLPTTDIFSFGVMMYLLLVGKWPFGEIVNPITLAIYIRNVENEIWDKEALKKKYPQWFDLIDGCLKANYKDRLQSVDRVLSLIPGQKSLSHSSDCPTLVNGLKVICGRNDLGKTIELKSSRTLTTIGRKSNDFKNDLDLNDPEKHVSRAHCTIEYSSQDWLIRDGQMRNGKWKHSLNGTFVNSTSCKDNKVVLKVGDIIALGDVRIKVM